MTLGSKKKRWQQQEKEIEEKVAGKRTKGSGAGYKKGDIQSDHFIVECKTTKFKSFSITDRLIKKLEADSFGSDKIPVFSIELENGKHRCYVISDHDFEHLIMRLMCS